jgi:PAS domain S-box-containing protein
MTTELRVLIVDDDPDYLNLMAGHLKRRGFDLVAQQDGTAALQLLRGGEHFAVLVTDLMMPGLDGYDLLRQARTMDPFLEVVVISGAGSLESAISSMRENGAFDYLPKPLEKMSDLSLAVERAAAHRRLRLDTQELQARILEERERLNAVVSNAGDAILAADAEGHVTVANPAARTLLGEGEFIGRVAGTILPPPLAVLLSHWRVIENERPIVTEVPWPQDRVHMVSLTPIRDTDPEGAHGWVMVLREVTHLRRLEDLEMQLLSDAAGKIRAPLAQAFTSVLEMNDLVETRSEAFTVRMERLVQQLSAIRKWTEDLGLLVEMESGAGLHPSAVALSEIVGEWEGSASYRHLEEKGLTARLALEEDLPPVYADREAMRLLLDQLIAQAIWRSPQGGEIQVGLRQAEGQVWLEVGDEGPSAPVTDLPHLFERVFAEPGDGPGPTGLELALAKAVVDKAGGQILLRNYQPAGMTVAVALPPSPDRASRRVP